MKFYFQMRSVSLFFKFYVNKNYFTWWIVLHVDIQEATNKSCPYISTC